MLMVMMIRVLCRLFHMVLIVVVMVMLILPKVVVSVPVRIGLMDVAT